MNQARFLYNNSRELRRAFWRDNPHLDRKKTPFGYKTDTRCAFVDWVDAMVRDGAISERLARYATLEGRT